MNNHILSEINRHYQIINYSKNLQEQEEINANPSQEQPKEPISKNENIAGPDYNNFIHILKTIIPLTGQILFSDINEPDQKDVLDVGVTFIGITDIGYLDQNGREHPFEKVNPSFYELGELTHKACLYLASDVQYTWQMGSVKRNPHKGLG